MFQNDDCGRCFCSSCYFLPDNDDNDDNDSAFVATAPTVFPYDDDNDDFVVADFVSAGRSSLLDNDADNDDDDNDAVIDYDNDKYYNDDRNNSALQYSKK